ncbi:MAG: prephenate dehydratase [Elusimicrobia bacterium]|nr:prephenate dehydratase [Elusimicrobiota bacterium]
MKVAFQGVKGAYSEEAARKHFKDGCEPSGYAYSEQVFETVASGVSEYGILPVENSIAGAVAVNLDLLLKEDVFVVAECYLPIRHCLLAHKGVSLEEVKQVFSHPVALAQCRDFLTRRLIKAVPEYDTAGSAKLIAERHIPGEAAIASKGCAEAYGLNVLEENIQTVKDNITRFFIFVRGSKAPKGQTMQKTSLVFGARHKPGSLLDCLKRFADHGINLTRLESRPVPENPFEYVFFVDLVGGLEDKGVQAAIAELAEDAHRVKVLGSYPVAPR